MTKKKFFASLGVMTALVGTTVCGAMLCMGNTSADAASLKDEVGPASAAVTLASSATDWQDGALVDGALWNGFIACDLGELHANSSSKDVLHFKYCPNCGEACSQYEDISTDLYTSVLEQNGCNYTFLHHGPRGSVVCSGTIAIHNGEEFTVPSTCANEGYVGVRCMDCGAEAVLETIPSLPHTYDNGESFSATSMYCADTKYTCTTCKTYYYYASTGTSARKAHTTELIKETPATCITSGTKTLACTDCSYQWTEETPKVAHTYGAGIVTKPATCVEDGVITYACTVCGGAQYTERIPLLGHEIVDIPAVDPTCTEAGHTAGSMCARCDKIIVEPIERSALGHAWGVWDDDRGSCDEVGTRSRTCSRCSEVEIEEIAAGTHSWDLGTITKQPTCIESGVKEFTCVVCGDTQTEIVEASGHKGVSIAAVSPTCTETGLTAGSECTLCGMVLEAQEVIPATGHALTRVAAVEPTTSSEGNIEYWYCRTCGLYFADKAGEEEIAQEDTILDRLPDAGDEDGDDEPVDADEDGGGMTWWQIALAVVAGVILIAGIGVVIDNFVINKTDNAFLKDKKSKSGKKEK